jgi:hypothetical protein
VGPNATALCQLRSLDRARRAGRRIAYDGRMRIALACALAGCAYRPGSFAHAPHDFVGQRVTVGCLDIAVNRRADLAIGPVLGYQFANRCDHATRVDLGAVRVIGRSPQGAGAVLRPYDPRREIRPVALDGRSVGAEALAYPLDRAMPEVCADAAALAHAAPPRWLCFAAPARPAAGGAP